jgi:hypothetical protein
MLQVLVPLLALALPSHNHKNHRPVLRLLQDRELTAPSNYPYRRRKSAPPTARLVEKRNRVFRTTALLPPKMFLLQDDSKTGDGKAREAPVTVADVHTGLRDHLGMMFLNDVLLVPSRSPSTRDAALRAWLELLAAKFANEPDLAAGLGGLARQSDEALRRPAAWQELVQANLGSWTNKTGFGYSNCRNSTSPEFCGVWVLAHTLLASTNSDADGVAVLRTFASWVHGWFGCVHCRDHFVGMTHGEGSLPPLARVASREGAVSWLWHAHNIVNARAGNYQFGRDVLRAHAQLARAARIR